MTKFLISITFFLFSSFANALIIENSKQIVFTPNEDISTIYSLNISGRLLDVSFDQSFGTPDVKSLGVEDPIEALYTVLEVTNNVWIYNGNDTPYHLTYKFPFATFSNGLGGMIIYVQKDADSAYRGEYSAGWIWSEVSKAEPKGLVYFRHAVPNAFLTTVPEPNTFFMLLLSVVFVMLVSRRNVL